MWSCNFVISLNPISSCDLGWARRGGTAGLAARRCKFCPQPNNMVILFLQLEHCKCHTFLGALLSSAGGMDFVLSWHRARLCLGFFQHPAPTALHTEVPETSSLWPSALCSCLIFSRGFNHNSSRLINDRYEQQLLHANSAGFFIWDNISLLKGLCFAMY